MPDDEDEKLVVERFRTMALVTTRAGEAVLRFDYGPPSEPKTIAFELPEDMILELITGLQDLHGSRFARTH
jgi:hypothetical protein